MTELNELLDQAAQCCSELGARSENGAAAVHDVVAQAQALGNAAAQEAQRLHHDYTDAIAAIQHARDQLDGGVDHAARAVNDMASEALQAATAAKDTLVAMEGEVIHLAEARAA